MKLRSNRYFRIQRKKFYVRIGNNTGNRSEMSPDNRAAKTSCWKELDLWLLWAGISPEAGEPVSHIGIYTDFT